MKAYLDQRQKLHDPKHFLVRGKQQTSPEQPARIDVLCAGAEAAGCEFESPTDHGTGPLAAVHSVEYLEFLQTIHARWIMLEGAANEVIPNVHPDHRTASYPHSPIGQAGYHQSDTACPIAAHTWESAYWSAQTACTAIDTVIAGEGAAYALCRPPGHHAFGDLAGGFCFLNNAAVAAQRALQSGLRPAIVDVDVHHGNGTQGIFYRRADVLTVSLHADPTDFYPFFWGHAHERGEDAGLGFNVNLPLPQGTGDSEYLRQLDLALARVQTFGADVLIVALGLDAYENDPLRGLSITTKGFAGIGNSVARCGLPVLFVQEGGYLCDELGHNLTSLLSGFKAGVG